MEGERNWRGEGLKEEVRLEGDCEMLPRRNAGLKGLERIWEIFCKKKLRRIEEIYERSRVV